MSLNLTETWSHISLRSTLDAAAATAEVSKVIRTGPIHRSTAGKWHVLQDWFFVYNICNPLPMKTQTLLLITDISGFTRFVAQSDPDTGIARAQEMLQIIVDSNDLGLELCEIEGDAVFFYLKSGLPSFSRLLAQIRRTFAEFQAYLREHGLESALGIKFFIHVGHCQSITVGGHTKLFGLDVIMIHRLLKGRFKSSNYLLITSDASEVLCYDGSNAQHGSVQLEHIGIVDYMVLNEQMLSAGEPVIPRTDSLLEQVMTSIHSVVTEISTRHGHLMWRPMAYGL